MARAAKFRIYGDYPNLDRVPKELRRAAMPQITDDLAEIARAEAPKRRGSSSSKSIVSRIKPFVEKDGLIGHVMSRAPHSHLIEFGVQGHSLQPGSGKRRWRKSRNPNRVIMVYGDPSIIRRGAYHGGSGANPFMERTNERGPDVAEKALQETALEALEKCIDRGVEWF